MNRIMLSEADNYRLRRLDVSSQSGGGIPNLPFTSLFGPTCPVVNLWAIEYNTGGAAKGYTLADTHKQ